MLTGYIGTYNTASTKGIYQFSYEENSGKISDIQSFLSINDAKCVDRYENMLIITTSKNNKSGIALIDISTKTILDEILLENSSPCFVKHHDDFIYTANYHDGVVMVYQIVNNKLKLIKQISIQNKAGCHQVVLYKNYLIVPCLLLDQVRIFDINNDYDFILVNFANPDMVGHTGNMDAATKACMAIDICLGKILELAEDNFYKVILLADHGNAEIMVNDDGSMCTTHTTSKVPFIICDNKVKLKESGSLINVAPTILDYMDIAAPIEMEGTESLLVDNN